MTDKQLKSLTIMDLARLAGMLNLDMHFVINTRPDQTKKPETAEAEAEGK